MCIAAIAFAAHPNWRLVAIANRDEFHDRPSAPLARWADSPILAGQDLRSGGTWLGVSEGSSSFGQGRLVLVTNHRVPGYPLPDRPSRGGLVTDLLAGADPERIALAAYNPFNLAVVGASAAHILSSYPDDARQPLAPGVHGLSNGPVMQPWPKTRQLCADLAGWLATDTGDTAPLFAALARESVPGVLCLINATSADPDPAQSPAFIRHATYGTRCSTIVTVDRHGIGQIIERRFSATGAPCGETALNFGWHD